MILLWLLAAYALADAIIAVVRGLGSRTHRCGGVGDGHRVSPFWPMLLRQWLKALS
jgi:hypothetical protein